MKNNLYEILKLDPEASISDIKKSFRKLSIKYHPDKFDKDMSTQEQEEALKQYELITLAHTILTNEDTRKEYDQMFYVEKRNEDYFSVKNNYKKFHDKERIDNDNKKSFETYNKELIEQRHKDLESSYRPRTLEEYTSKRDSQLASIEIPKVSLDTPVEKQIIKKLEPTALLSNNVSNYQNINDIGNMFGEVDSSILDTFTIENIDTKVKITDVDKSLKEYLDQTDELNKIAPDQFDETGHLILDKIIQFK